MLEDVACVGDDVCWVLDEVLCSQDGSCDCSFFALMSVLVCFWV